MPQINRFESDAGDSDDEFGGADDHASDRIGGLKLTKIESCRSSPNVMKSGKGGEPVIESEVHIELQSVASSDFIYESPSKMTSPDKLRFA